MDENKNIDGKTLLKNALTNILDKYYTPWYKVEDKNGNISVTTDSSINCCVKLSDKQQELWYLETFIYHRPSGSASRFLICGYFPSVEELAAQVLRNILNIELDIHINLSKEGIG